MEAGSSGPCTSEPVFEMQKRIHAERVTTTCCEPRSPDMEAGSSGTRTMEPVFEMQKRIHAERGPRESVLYDPTIMEMIFRKLGLKNQNKFRLVCKKWYDMAHMYWSKSSFNCEEQFQKLQKTNPDSWANNFKLLVSLIKERPMLKRIVCDLWLRKFVQELIEVIPLYVEDLHHIELGYVTLSQVKSFAEKYKNLKSVHLDIGSPDLLESVKCFGQCESIKTLIFFGNSRKNKHSYAAICRAVTENYPKLKSLALMNIVSCDMAEELEHLLLKKSTNFFGLKLNFYEYSRHIGDVLGLCVKLKKLELVLHSPKDPFHLSSLKNLKDLSVSFYGDVSNDVVSQTVASFISEGPLESLKNLHLELLGSEVDLTLICYNLKNLEKVSLCSVNQSTVSTLLECMVNLRKLTALDIVHKGLTENNVKCIAKCKQLKQLSLFDCKFTEPVFLLLRECSELESLDVSDTEKITMPVIKRFVKYLPRLRKLHLIGNRLSLKEKQYALDFFKDHKINTNLQVQTQTIMNF